MMIEGVKKRAVYFIFVTNGPHASNENKKNTLGPAPTLHTQLRLKLS